MLQDRFEHLTYHLAATILHVLDGAFWICNLLQRAPIQVLDDTDTWTDSEIIHAVKNSPYLKGSDDRIVQFSQHTVVKVCGNTRAMIAEARAQELVCAQTRIPVPRVRRTIYDYSNTRTFIVMDYVRNSKQLKVVWPTLSLWRKLVVVLTIRSYLRQLRRVRHSRYSDRPGSLSEKPIRCSSLQFGLNRPKGPFPTISALVTYFRNEYRDAEYRASVSGGWTRPPNCPPLDASLFTPLVFTHNDLNMRNFLLDDNNVLWMIDWGFSGFYPWWFEYLGMTFATQKDRDVESWQRCVPYMAKPAFEIEEWMRQIGYDYKNLP